MKDLLKFIMLLPMMLWTFLGHWNSLCSSISHCLHEPKFFVYAVYAIWISSQLPDVAATAVNRVWPRAGLHERVLKYSVGVEGKPDDLTMTREGKTFYYILVIGLGVLMLLLK